MGPLIALFFSSSSEQPDQSDWYILPVCWVRCFSSVNAKQWVEARLATFLFWNVHKQPDQRLLANLCHEQRADVIALAELEIPGPELTKTLNSGVEQLYHEVISPTRRVKMFSRLPVGSVRLVSDDLQISIRQIIPPIGKDALLVAVHLQSKLHTSDDEQLLNATRLIHLVEAAEEKVGHTRTVLLGDFNMNPFDSGLVGADALHAVMDHRTAATGSRTVDGRLRKYFYNPMWQFFGSGHHKPRGTYYRKDNSQICYFWNMFDQVLIRPELLEFMPDTNVRLVDKIGTVSLLRDNGLINTEVSDHLPVIATIDLERM